MMTPSLRSGFQSGDPGQFLDEPFSSDNKGFLGLDRLALAPGRL